MWYKRPSWYTRVAPVTGARRTVCLGEKTTKREAAKREAWLATIADRGDPLGILTAVASKALTVAEAYQLGELGTQGKLEADRAEAARLAALAAKEDFSPLVAEWERWIRQHRPATAGEYVRHVRALYPDRPLYLEHFSRVQVAKRLDDLTVPSGATRNRYKTGCSSFLAFLIRRGHLSENPTHGIKAFPERESPMRIWELAQAQRILAHLSATDAALASMCAYMAGAGAEWACVVHAEAGDFDVTKRTVLMRGTKSHAQRTNHRLRWGKITEPWTVPYLAPALEGKSGAARVWPGAVSREWRAVKAFQRALKKLGLPHATLHDWRHTYAVTCLRRGELPATVAHQLGHANTALLWKRYGKYVTELRDYKTEGPEAGA